MFAVHGNVRNVVVGEAVVSGLERCAAIIADLDAFAFRADDEFLRVLLIDDERVDDPVAWRYALEVFLVDGLPQTTGGASIQRVGIRGIHANQLRAAEDVRNALVLNPL